MKEKEEDVMSAAKGILFGMVIGSLFWLILIGSVIIYINK
jgi:uncharacterized membrane protein